MTDIDQLASCTALIFGALRTSGQLPDSFPVMRAAWILGAEDDARTIHGTLGDHDPAVCPICTPDCMTPMTADATVLDVSYALPATEASATA